MSKRKCGGCGHDPACGHASITVRDVETWYCHSDDHSCYVLPQNGLTTHVMSAKKRADGSMEIVYKLSPDAD